MMALQRQYSPTGHAEWPAGMTDDARVAAQKR